MQCKFIYKDPVGNTSALYDAVEKRYGPEKAEEIYVRRMMDMVDTKFSLNVATSIDAMRKQAENLEQDPSHTDPDDVSRVDVDRQTGETLLHVTSFLASKIQQPKTLIGASSLEKAKARQIANLIEKVIHKEEYELLSDEELLQKATHDVEALWNAKPATGTQMHRAMQLASLKLEEIRDAAESGDSEAKDLIESGDPALVGHIIYEVRQQMQEESDEVSLSTASMTTVFRVMLDTVKKKEATLKDKDGNPRRLHLRPELPIRSNTMVPPGTGLDGLVGTIDLFLETAEGDYCAIVDYKTHSKIGATEFGRLTGDQLIQPFDKPASKATVARAQELIYAAIMKTQYNRTVTETVTIQIPVEMRVKEGFTQFGSREYEGRDLSIDPEAKVTSTGFIPVGNDVNQILIYFREEGDMKNYYDAARAGGINGIVETWSGRNAEGNPNATFAKYNREAAVNDRITKQRKLSNGNMVVDFFNRTTNVSNMSDEEIRKKLEEIYDEEKAMYNNVANDIINIFDHPGSIPKHLRGRETPIMKLIHGYSPETHTMELAQSYDFLKDVGPDIIIVTDKRNGAVSFLSAVTINNTHVNFQSDGSKGKRTSLLGNYVTDDYYPSTTLTTDIYTAPSTHDFIAMKLGMTALRWMNAHGNDVKIDSMKVASILPSDSSYSITPTTLLQELRKLELFRGVAGEEFPKDIAKIMDELPTNFAITSSKGKVDALMNMIQSCCDPLGKDISNDFRNGLIKSYMDYVEGGIRTYEFKYNLAKYQELVQKHLKQQGKSDAAILADPEYLLVTRAIAEMEKFDFSVRKLASDRVNVKYNKSAITSGDPVLLRLNVLYRNESSNIRQEMNSFQREHNKLIDALRHSKNMVMIGAPEKLFTNMFINDGLPEHRMMLKEEGSSDFNMLTREEQDYIKFFNKHCRIAMANIASIKNKNDILVTERFWKEGTVPVIKQMAKLLDPKNFKNWQAIKDAMAAQYYSRVKATSEKTSDISFVFDTRFDGQATDEGIGNSEVRRVALGLTDMSNPGEISDDIEKNLALILNMATIEASEKRHMGYVLHVANAMSSVLAGEDDADRTGMTQEMLQAWRNMNLFNKSLKEPNAAIAGMVDVVGKTISALIFNYSIRQSMNEFFQNTAHSLSAVTANVIMKEMTNFLGGEDNARFSLGDWTWAGNVMNYFNPKFEQMIYDAGLIKADVDDLKDEDFRAMSKIDRFKSKSAQAMNKIWFETMTSQIFLAQMKKQGVTEAYVLNKETGAYEYDERLDPRFFVWDAEKGIGERAPQTEEESKRNAKWLTTRKIMNEEGSLTQPVFNEDGTVADPGGKMTQPLIAPENSEIKAYSLRLFGSFNKDGQSIYQNESLFRAMGKYKSWWLVGKLANVYTPVVEDEAMYGKWVYDDNNDGTWSARWAKGNYRGAINTVWNITKELAKYRDIAVLRDLDRYEQEVVAHLISDLLIAALLALLILPIIANREEIIDANGKKTIALGSFANSITGESAYKTMVGAIADLTFISNWDSMTKGMFPALSIASNLGTAVTQGLGHLIAPNRILAPDGKKWLMLGPVRTISIFDELRRGDWISTTSTI